MDLKPQGQDGEEYGEPWVREASGRARLGGAPSGRHRDRCVEPGAPAAHPVLTPVSSLLAAQNAGP